MPCLPPVTPYIVTSGCARDISVHLRVLRAFSALWTSSGHSGGEFKVNSSKTPQLVMEGVVKVSPGGITTRAAQNMFKFYLEP